MPFDFIFMLTRNDATVNDAHHHLPVAVEAGVRHIGFKDVGLSIEELEELHRAIKDSGATSYLEVVSLDRDSEIASAEAGLRLGVDVLMGGTRAEDVVPMLAGTDIRYRPFPGEVVGHPSVLTGTVDEIVADARRLTAMEGVEGLDLLAYRFDGDVPALMEAVCGAVDKPVVAAGSIDGPGRIHSVAAAGCAGFTIGTAALNGMFPATGTDLASQLAAIQTATRAAMPGGEGAA